MFEFLKKLLPKENLTKVGLEKALAEGLITKEEFLRLKVDRAENKLANFLREKKLKKR